MRQDFQLPMTLTHLVTHPGDKTVLHSLDFDIVTVDNSEEEAWERHVQSVKTYVECGLSKGWQQYIRFRAPDEAWAQLTPDTPVRIMPPIVIEGRQTTVYAVTPKHEYLCAAG
ncbi:MAG: hypothetical protein ABSD98_07350 [Candidatus Korobacteraceae bacterium]|jgi:hypothetical protein